MPPAPRTTPCQKYRPAAPQYPTPLGWAPSMPPPVPPPTRASLLLMAIGAGYWVPGAGCPVGHLGVGPTRGHPFGGGVRGCGPSLNMGARGGKRLQGCPLAPRGAWRRGRWVGRLPLGTIRGKKMGPLGGCAAPCHLGGHGKGVVGWVGCPTPSPKGCPIRGAAPPAAVGWAGRCGVSTSHRGCPRQARPSAPPSPSLHRG